MAFNPLASFLQGSKGRNQLDAQNQQNQVRELQTLLSGQAGQAGFNPAQSPELQQLAALDPSSAGNMLSVFQNLDKSRQKAFFQDAREGKRLLQAGDGEGFLNLASNRLNDVQRLGGDPSDVMSILQSFNSGDIQGTINQLAQTEQLGVEGGFLKDIGAEKAKNQAKPVALSDTEKNFKKLTSLESQLSAAEKSGDQKAVDAATRQIDNFKTLSAKFGATTQTKADIAVDKANRIELAKHASKASSEAFNGLKNIRSTILNIGDAIKALDKGADTGPIISKLPSFRESSIELDNIRNRMGLDVVGSTTFGALSESELAFALDTALPDDLQPKALKSWLKRKKDAQTKLAKGLRDAAKFLGKPGNTIADYIEKQELSAAKGSASSGLTEAEAEELRQLESEFGGI